MKKWISVLLAFVLLLSMAACGSAPAAPAEEDSSGNTTVQTKETEPKQTEPPVVFEETIIVDDENCTLKITAIENDAIWGYTLRAYLENKTEKDLMFSLSNVSVNGYMCDPVWAATVTAGMKSNENIRFASDSFDRNGIKTVTDIEFQLDIYDSNDWMAEHLVSEVFHIYPMGEDAVQVYPREPQTGDIVLFDNEECTMIVTGYDPDSMWGYTMNVYLVNKTDKNLMFSVQDASVNGFMCDPFWAHTVAAGKASNTNINWFTSTLEEAGITEVESLTLPIRIYDAGDWMAEDILNETFTVEP